MNNKKEIKLGYDDVAIVPEVVTTISSRSECSPYDEDGFLPIFASCMSSVVSIENAKDFNNAKIRTVIPRDISIDERMDYMFSQANGFGTNCNFVSFSLNEIKEYFLGKIFVTEGRKYYKSFNVCIDLANGHMQEVIDAVKMLKDRYGNGICIMTGNIANPETYREYEKAGLDFIRCSIGTGCFTEDMQVETENGTKLIKDVVIGDKVKTHNGKYETVYDTMSFYCKEKLYDIDGIKCTSNHKFYVINKEDENKVTVENIADYAFWIKAENLDKDKHCLIQL